MPPSSSLFKQAVATCAVSSISPARFPLRKPPVSAGTQPYNPKCAIRKLNGQPPEEIKPRGYTYGKRVISILEVVCAAGYPCYVEVDFVSIFVR